MAYRFVRLYYLILGVNDKMQADHAVMLVQCNTDTNNITTITIAIPTEATLDVTSYMNSVHTSFYFVTIYV